MRESNPTRDEIMEHMSRAFFATAWADWADEYGPGTAGNGVDVMDEMPDELDGAATLGAVALTASLEEMHGMDLSEVFRTAKAVSRHYKAGDRARTAEMFGHYAAMGAMGHGVGLWDALGTEACDFVNTRDCHMEFSPFDLDPAEYPIPAEGAA